MEITDRGYIGLYRVCNFGVIVGLLGQGKRENGNYYLGFGVYGHWD